MVIKLDFIFFRFVLEFCQNGFLDIKILKAYCFQSLAKVSHVIQYASFNPFCSLLSSYYDFLEFAALTYHVPPLLKCRPTDIINKRPTNTFSLMASQFAATVCGFKTVAGIPSLPILNVGISWCLLCCDTHVCQNDLTRIANTHHLGFFNLPLSPF